LGLIEQVNALWKSGWGAIREGVGYRLIEKKKRRIQNEQRN